MDFPEPEGPTIETYSLRRMVRSAWRTACTSGGPGNARLIPAMRTTGAATAGGVIRPPARRQCVLANHHSVALRQRIISRRHLRVAFRGEANLDLHQPDRTVLAQHLDPALAARAGGECRQRDRQHVAAGAGYRDGDPQVLSAQLVHLRRLQLRWSDGDLGTAVTGLLDGRDGAVDLVAGG